ncbi:MAG: NAD-dependent epimerase/dehydratase family protein [Candidatus Brocadia sp. AMX2]|uniref:CDP-paratose 2-epimerase n=1 Tax=Candidatus Brocadia sinica JPN1 TaxID=1197129 RepID=A0ABQ0JX55_9BACT|nr:MULTISPECIES: NAD-dependent epimerase/dehydratase family protein [Brocadia]MBC6933173.1 NAD-dependent epimerase/dehydratase family protein [Candidatus Brocadia sp.]MBL1169636.1 NAD-dependent epimerase/dehydratase family protein [Candidatus Brocadia sp. AMX1]MCK6468172.1 NAD-dependent epimerase/dehydratase family protein [Candidatus Brocadia sinica]NOG40842.1 NAD-dependent epimerase/dehydratase family protein [Planctomycetota bacterium]KAA0243271.1 MAG: NAD-dependent epimerase/dehydratase fa
MSVVLITGSSGLIGSESAQYFHGKGFEVWGIDNNMRRYFFGEDGSTQWKKEELLKLNNYKHFDMDIRDFESINKLFKQAKNNLSLVIHTAAQPSHDWAAREPLTDFSVNATGTLNLLEATRLHTPHAVFIFTSTNKVYGDLPNKLPLVELETRWEVEHSHRFFQYGIDESMSIDQSKHSVFGASKVAGDIMVQEYGRYFGMRTGIFRGGCLTGPAHSGAELHGFLAYLVKCSVQGRKYTVYGYKGKQVRDNIHSSDLVNAFWHFYQNPRIGEVYNIGGSRQNNCSILEATQIVRDFTGKEFECEITNSARIGDHIWWISDVRKFQNHYPKWNFKYGIRDIIKEIIDVLKEKK